MASEMIERVARAILKNNDELGHAELKMFECEALARASIEAMREPSVAMLDAAERDGWVGPRTARGCWSAMIDAALKEARNGE